MDFRYAFRTLARTPGFTLMAVATLALGIGINTVVFTVYGSVAFHQLAVRAPGELERLRWSRESYPDDVFSWDEFGRLAAGGGFASVVATSDTEAVVADQEVAHARFVSGNYFEALGVEASVGRAPGAGDRGGVVVSDGYWRRKLHSDPFVYGRTIRAGSASLTIPGVTPASFEGTGEPPQVPDLWISANDQRAVLPGVDWIHDAAARQWQLLARRAPGVSHSQAQADLAVMGASWPVENGKRVTLSSLPATFFQTDTGEFQGFALVCGILLVAVMLILLMGCINLVNLMVARNASRGHEIAVRMALGASRSRLLRQLCSESLLLGMAGGAAGWALSSVACQWMEARVAQLFADFSAGSFAPALRFSPDWRTFLWSAGLAITTGVLVGLGPAMRASKRAVNSVLRQAGSAGGLDITRRRNILVAAQVASCLVLLTAAGLLFRGAAESPKTDPGFDTVHTMRLTLDAETLAATPAARAAVVNQAIAEMRAVPGVQAVAWADRAPFLGHGIRPFTNEGGARLSCVFNGVSEDYFRTLGIGLVAGRTFTQAEVEAGAPVAVISESTARKLWPGANPLGRRISNGKWYTVIGMVRTVRSTHLSKADEGYVYLTKPVPDSFATLLIRTSGAPERLFRTLSARLSGVNANLPAVVNMMAIAQTPLKLELWMAQAPAMAAAGLGGLALLLACLGVMGVVSRLVALRTREIGIRIALGARQTDVVKVIGRQTMFPVLWGAVAGLAGALGVSALLQSLIVLPDVPDPTYGAGAFDPVTFLGVLAVLALTVALAGAGPMRRAVRVDPATALRDQ